jgi:hypothetical protein
MAGIDKDRAVAERAATSRFCGYGVFLTACVWFLYSFGAPALAAETGARPLPREFDPFDILAWELLAGIDASGDALSHGDARAGDRVRIAIRPFSAGKAPLPASLANAYNDKLIVSLLSQGGSRYRFIAREALGAVIKEIDESSSREAELDDLLTALVEHAKADVLVVGKLRRTSDETAVLSYEAVKVRDGTILAATSYQRLPLDPAEVDLAARSETLHESAKPGSRPKSDDLLDVPIGAGADWGAERSIPKPRAARPDREVASVQADLRALGYDPGPVDGILGARTVAAIRDYQRDMGLPVDGRPSATLIDSLRAELTASKAKPLGLEPVADRPSATRPYGSDGTYCREFQHKVTIGGTVQASYGRACLQADGSWKIVK